MSRKPIILITLDAESPGGYSKMPWYALRQNYCDVIHEAGGVPLPVPHHVGIAEEYAVLGDGFVFTGGAFDIDPKLYGNDHCHDTVTTKQDRTDFEWRLLQLAYDQKKPMLGICGGMQLMNVVLGGTLIQHIPAEVPDCLAHEQPQPRTDPGHDIEVYKDTLLHRLVHEVMVEGKIPVNSAHHQAVKDLGAGFLCNSIASDGVIEGIEDPNHPFCLGVQWHPEYHISEADKNIFVGLIQAARQ
jgi:putative glutamine amidotransferase